MSDPPVPTSEPPRKSLFAYAGFNKLFAGSLLGTLADRLYQMSLIAAANVIFIGMGSEGERKIVGIQIAATLPGLFLYALAGALVDSCDRRRLMMLIKAAKVLVVLLLAPLVWRVVNLDPANPEPELQQTLIALWPWCLAVVVLLAIISVPFAPARAAAVPDVAPGEHRSLGASLMATTGLISLLLGSMVGSLLARTDWLGPANVVLIASGLYLFSALFFWRLPDAAAVPANRRGENAQTQAPKLTFPEYLRGIGEGLAYCLRHLHILGLIFFETVFWTLGSAFYVLLLFHARTELQLAANEKTLFFGLGLGCAGIGLFGGAIGIGKICHRVSPIVTYTPAFLLLAAGLYGVFQSSPVDGRAPYWVYAVLLGLGLGGGLTLGRVDADVLATTDEKIRGRVFSLKALAFAATILVTMLTITEAGLTDEQTRQLALWLPRAIFLMLPLVFLFSWAVDIAAWSSKAVTSLPGPLHRFGYATARFICWLFIKILFRYEVHGAEKIPRTGPCILAANHASFLDPIFLGCCTRRIVQWTMYASYYRSWAHPVFRFLRCIPVDEKSTTAALKANVRSLEQGACLGIFPEGHVSDDGKLQRPQPGAFFLAQRSGATIVPVAIKGNYEALPRQAKFPRPRKVEIFVLEPFTVPKELSREQVAELADKMMADVARALGTAERKKGRTGEGEKLRPD